MRILLVALALPPLARAQRPAPEPALRSIAVLEWTGEEQNPKGARLIPVAILADGKLEDGSLYLARPRPLALGEGVEYELERDGQPFALFEVERAGQERGLWVGLGRWKPLAALSSGKSAPAPRPEASQPIYLDIDGGKAPRGGETSPRQPQEKRPASSPPADDPDRPALRKTQPTKPRNEGYVESLPGANDPDRPRLRRGRAEEAPGQLSPGFEGMPAEMRQVVAISDARPLPPRRWSYAWPGPEEEANARRSLEQAARAALTPAADLRNVQLRAFELAYGQGPTLVFTAESDEPPAARRYITLLAQPDLYGKPLILLSSVARADRLDAAPRLRLLDVVNACNDGQGDLLFELRSQSERQFALYRIAHGRASEIFVSGGEPTTAF